MTSAAGAVSRAPRARIPEPTVTRLPVYRRLLASLAANRVPTVSSTELAEAAGVNAATLRRDLSHLGTYGTPGTGYDVVRLCEMVDRALALGRDWPIVIAGAGNLGHALARSRGFTTGGFRVAALVDVDPGQVGRTIDGVPIAHVDDLPGLVTREHVALGVVATPASAAGDVVRRLAGAGVRAILNFTPAVVPSPEGVLVRSVDLAAELQVLTFHLARTGEGLANLAGDASAEAPADGPAGPSQ